MQYFASIAKTQKRSQGEDSLLAGQKNQMELFVGDHLDFFTEMDCCIRF